ncbi:DNA polymerase Y family protein [Croceibacterium mercuriale]|uniref:DNA polymerase Y family protein n=1 Tax=Croceibacterium mercuriale TaxID=1572751 RepID=UPI001F26DFF7|nr:DNA polymerase Y family protein [Croceibacterium mercuriale]
MKRVASLYLPSWSIDRLRRIGRWHAPSAEAGGGAPPSTPPEASFRTGFAALGADAAAERAQHCSVPKEGGWRPGARWARSDPDAGDRAGGSGLADTRNAVEAVVAALPAHQRPPQRELGRTSQAADHPFRKGLTRPPEERVAAPAPLRELSRRTEAAEPLFRPGTRGWQNEDLQASVDGLPAHRRPSLQELSRKTEVLDNPFRPMPPDEFGPARRIAMPSLQFPGEDAPAKAGRGAALRGEEKRDRHRNEAPSLRQLAAMPPVHGPGEDVVVRRAMKAPKRSARDGHGGEAGHVAAPNVAQSMKQLAAMPAVQFPGEGPHPDNHGRSEPTAPTYGQGRFFQTGRTLASVVSRVCGDEDPGGHERSEPDEPPLVTVRKIGPRVEVAAANGTARALGIGPGTALTMARAQVPGLEVRDADPEGDAASLAALAELLARRWAPTVAISDADGLFVELTGVAHLYGGEGRFCRRLLRLLARHGIAARVAVADTAGAAWALARFGPPDPAQILPTGMQGQALASLPVAALRLEPRALELLARLGVDCIGQLAAMPRAPMVRRFGRTVTDRIDQALGHVPEPFEPVIPPTRVAVRQGFAEPIATPEAIEHWLRQLMGQLAVALAQAGQGARSVELVAERVDGVPQRLRLGFARATRDPAYMLRLTLRRMEEIEPGYGIDAIALLVRRADPLGAEALSPALAHEGEADLAPLIDALANRIGPDRLWRAVPIESDVPERCWTRAAPLDLLRERMPVLRLDDVRHLDARTPDHPWHPRWPRPVLLLRRPERIDHVLAEMPDQPPKRFTWRGTTHRVIRAEGPERVAGEWWRRSPEREAVRDYFRVEDEAGQRFWLFRRGDGMRSETGDLSWFIHGLGD